MTGSRKQELMKLIDNRFHDMLFDSKVFKNSLGYNVYPTGNTSSQISIDIINSHLLHDYHIKDLKMDISKKLLLILNIQEFLKTIATAQEIKEMNINIKETFYT